MTLWLADPLCSFVDAELTHFSPTLGGVLYPSLYTVQVTGKWAINTSLYSIYS